MDILQKNRIVDEACRVLTDLEKACHILNYWQNEYLFIENPDPRAAVACGSGTGNNTAHREAICPWCFEYKWITNFIEVASDYVFEAKKRLEEALEQQ